jgi:hypothetical protein
MTRSDLHAKLAKLLRMQSSCNANEAANASRLLNKLCSEAGLDPSDITGDEDDTSLQAIYYQYGNEFSRMDYASALLFNSVAKYYNGDLVVTRCGHRKSYFKVFCTEGNKIRIEVYYEYLLEVMNDLADKAKKANPGSRNNFRLNFRKAFADEIGNRLDAMREEDRSEGPALVRVDKERKAVRGLMDEVCNRLRSTSTTVGHGASAGREAAGGVGLSEQVAGGRSRMLVGG